MDLVGLIGLVLLVALLGVVVVMGCWPGALTRAGARVGRALRPAPSTAGRSCASCINASWRADLRRADCAFHERLIVHVELDAAGCTGYVERVAPAPAAAS